MAREIRPEVLKPHLFSEIDPGLAARIAPGDLVVAGTGFGAGHPHAQGMYALAGAGVGVVAASIPRGTFRNLVVAGVPFMTGCLNAVALCENGDELEVDFTSGRFTNLTRGRETQFAPLDTRLLDQIAAGGWMPMFKRRLAESRLEAAQV
jgi:3-isopropylmalate/(R)-2-methylmalate dehydratase small subunit